MMDYVNITPLVDPIVNWAQFAPFEPKRPARETFITHTHSARSKDEPFDLFASAIGARAPTPLPEARARNSLQHASTVSEFTAKPSLYAMNTGAEAEIDRISKQRVKLMAAKYATSTASAEIVARLEILNRRLLDRSPRVSKDQVDSLESANEKLVRIRAAREERSKRLGISA